MMKTWTGLRALIALSLVALSLIGLSSVLKTREPIPLYPATIDRDCAPWDGAAFTVSIPWRERTTIAVSIYQSPEIMHPDTFSFPDETLRDGSALLLLPAGLPEPLTGRVFFERVETGKVVEGRFDLVSAQGEAFSGTFRAEWGTQVVYCA